MVTDRSGGSRLPRQCQPINVRFLSSAQQIRVASRHAEQRARIADGRIEFQKRSSTKLLAFRVAQTLHSELHSRHERRADAQFIHAQPEQATEPARDRPPFRHKRRPKCHVA